MAESYALTLTAVTRVASLVLALGLTRCVTEEEILSGAPAAGAGGADAASADTAGAGAAESQGMAGDGAQASTPAWSSSTCYEALARGADGDPCTGTFGCDGPVRDCCQWSAACLGGSLSVVETCANCGCQVDDDCPFGLVCAAGQCVACSNQTACPFPLVSTLRNGCASCVTPSDCSSDEDCGADSICYPGRNCLPDCVEDPTCCSSNLCAAPGCGSAAELDCSIVGCDQGGVCNVVDSGHFCACESGRWLCSVASGNICIHP